MTASHQELKNPETVAHSSSTGIIAALSSGTQKSTDKSHAVAQKTFYGWLSDNIRWAYMNSPINFSFATGYRYPHISRLTGSPFTGRLAQFSKDKGIGNSTDISVHAASVAKQDSRGMCYWWVGPSKLLILVTKPDDLHQIFYQNKDNISRAEMIKDSLGIILGHESLLTIPKSDMWKKQREVVKRALYDKKPLTELVAPMHEIIDEHLAQLPLDSEVDLREFSTALPLDVMARTQLGTGSVAQSVKEVSKAYEDAFAATLDHGNIKEQKFAALTDFLRLSRAATPFEKAKYSLHDMLREQVLKLYSEQIKETDNLITGIASLRRAPDDAVPLDLNAEATINDLAFLMLAGHDTTARLLEHTIMLLDTHPVILEKLTKEIQVNRPATGEWERKDISKLVYLEMVLKETLRLYPSVPIIGTSVIKSLILADIPRTSNQKDYQKAMSNRDMTRDVVLQPGNVIIISPYITHRLPSLFEDPLAFKPERFEKEIDKCAWFPFSLGERDCIGRHFALQEASLIIVKIIEKYTFKIKEAIAHPFTETMLGILKPKTPSHVFFTPRADVQSEPLAAIQAEEKPGSLISDCS